MPFVYRSIHSTNFSFGTTIAETYNRRELTADSFLFQGWWGILNYSLYNQNTKVNRLRERHILLLQPMKSLKKTLGR